MSDAIGRPYFALDFSIGSANRGVMHSTVWRAKKDQAGGVVSRRRRSQCRLAPLSDGSR